MKTKLLLMTALLAVSAALASSSAVASTATVSPGGAVTGTTGAVQWQWETASRVLNCTTGGFTATLAPSTTGGLPLAISSDLTWRFGTGFGGGRCVLPGGAAGYTFDCAAGALSVTGPTVSGVTPGRVALRCLVSTGPHCSSTIMGSSPVSYDNATGGMTLQVAGQSLISAYSSDGSGGTCYWTPNDTDVRLSDSTRGNLRFVVSPATTVTVS